MKKKYYLRNVIFEKVKFLKLAMLIYVSYFIVSLINFGNKNINLVSKY